MRSGYVYTVRGGLPVWSFVTEIQTRKVRVENRNLENRRRPGCGESAPPIHQKSYTLYLASLEDYLHSNPPDYRFQVDSLLELLYYAFTEYNITESPEFKAKIGPLDRKLRALAETDEAAEKIIRRTNSADKPGKIIWRANLTALRLNGKMDA